MLQVAADALELTARAGNLLLGLRRASEPREGRRADERLSIHRVEAVQGLSHLGERRAGRKLIALIGQEAHEIFAARRRKCARIAARKAESAQERLEPPRAG